MFSSFGFDFRARDERCFFRQQKQDRVGHVLRAAHPPQRYARSGCFQSAWIVLPALLHSGQGTGGQQAVGANIIGRELNGQRFR
jgi:hypothetical protein